MKAPLVASTLVLLAASRVACMEPLLPLGAAVDRGKAALALTRKPLKPERVAYIKALREKEAKQRVERMQEVQGQLSALILRPPATAPVGPWRRFIGGQLPDRTHHLLQLADHHPHIQDVRSSVEERTASLSPTELRGQANEHGEIFHDIPGMPALKLKQVLTPGRPPFQVVLGDAYAQRSRHFTKVSHRKRREATGNGGGNGQQPLSPSRLADGEGTSSPNGRPLFDLNQPAPEHR